MEFQSEPGRIYLTDPTGKTIAEVTFPENADGTVTVNHTFVDSSLRGQNIAGQLMEALAQQLRQNKQKAQLTCSYAVHWFSKHQEQYQDILA